MGTVTPPAGDAAGRRIVGDGTPEAAWAMSELLARMPAVPLATLVPPGGRAVVVAPHPDDEILGTGGLLRQVVAAGQDAMLVAVTDGGGSHPGSSVWPASRLLASRPDETQDALRRLGVADAVPVTRLGLPDGGVTAAAPALRDALAGLLRAGDTVICTWEYDGHPDHEATGATARAAAAAVGARCVQVPIWAWHWARPDDPRVPWAHACRLTLTPADLEAKRAAMAAFVSQTTPDPSTGRPPILLAHALARLLRPFEVYFP